MPTAPFATARTAGLLALTLTLALSASALAPAQAARLLIEKSPVESGGSDSSDDHRDCDSRREVKYFFMQYLRHVDVSKTHDEDVYRVSGIGPAAPPKDVEAPALSGKFSLSGLDGSGLSKKYKQVRYVLIFDACDHKVLEQLQPPVM